MIALEYTAVSLQSFSMLKVKRDIEPELTPDACGHMLSNSFAIQRLTIESKIRLLSIYSKIGIVFLKINY